MEARDANIVYHDWESAHYDDKWSISFDDRCTEYVLGRFRKAVGPRPERCGRVLEIGAGTGFFLLNLWRAGLVEQAYASDISAGMAATCRRNGARLGTAVHATVADAQRLPYPPASFDLVVGHAVLHHLPDVGGALAEARRVLRPGGRLVVAGEPTVLGDALANQAKRLARAGVRLAAATGRGRVLRGQPELASEADRRAAALERDVDQHVFWPGQLRRLASSAGLVDVRTVTEELTASWFGWVNRTVEAMVRPECLPRRWPWLAYRTWRSLFAFDERLASPLLPAALSYNCVLTGAAPR